MAYNIPPRSPPGPGDLGHPGDDTGVCASPERPLPGRHLSLWEAEGWDDDRPPAYAALFPPVAAELHGASGPSGGQAPAARGAGRADALAARLLQARGEPDAHPLALALLTAMAELLADGGTDRCFRRRAERLLDPAVVHAVTRLLQRNDTRDLVWNYAQLIRLLLKQGVLSRDAALIELSRHRDADGLPPLLLQLATAARWSETRGEALGELVIALAPEGAASRGAFRRHLLGLSSPHGLPEDDKYRDFFGRLVREGELLKHRTPDRNPQGALACLEQFPEKDLHPTREEIRSHHSERRAEKIDLAFQCAFAVEVVRHRRRRSRQPGDCVAVATQLVRQLRMQEQLR